MPLRGLAVRYWAMLVAQVYLEIKSDLQFWSFEAQAACANAIMAN
jgi:hypothetical protein